MSPRTVLLVVLVMTATPTLQHFLDSSVLPDGREVALDLEQGQPRRMYFLMETDHRPIRLTVTPCSTYFSWSLSLKNFPAGTQQDEGPWNNLVPLYDHKGREGVLTSYFGRERHTFQLARAPAGLYVLEVESQREASRVLVLASSASGSGPHPQLPEDPSVKVLRVRRHRLLFAWGDSSPTATYCVAANPRHNYRSFCALHQDLEGPGRRTVTMIRDHVTNRYIKNDIHYECVGRKTWHTFNGLDEGKNYYIDVFALNELTNASTVYVGTNATTKASPGLPKLKDNTMMTQSLEARRGFTSTLEYNVLPNTPRLWVFMQSCSGPGLVYAEVSSTNTTYVTTEILDFKTLVLEKPEQGVLQIKLSSSIPHVRKVQAWISRKYHKFPYPALPDDKRILAFESLSTCNSVTIAWRSASDEKVRYCIYQRTADVWKTPRIQYGCDNLVVDGSTKEKVLCRRYHRFSKNRLNTNIIMQKIRGLGRGKTYIFDVYVTKIKGKTLSYEQVWVTTRQSCKRNT